MKRDASFRIPGPRWLYAATLGFLAFLLALDLFGPSAKVVDPNAPDPVLVAQLRKLWPNDSLTARDDDPRRGRFIFECESHGAPAADAIFWLFREKYAKGPNGFDEYSDERHDESRECAAWILGELADARLRERLVNALQKREEHPKFRRALAVALCRPRHREALPALLDRVLDRQESARIRIDLLFRLHRVGGEAPRRLRELLAHPFSNLDFHAAGTLGRWGDAAGAVLIRDGLRHFLQEETLARHLAMAANRLAGTDHQFREATMSHSGRDRNYEMLRHRVVRHLEALEGVVDLPPTPPAQPASFEELLAAGEDFDVAAASMLVANYRPEWIAVELQRLDRLADQLRLELDGLVDPEERIAALNRALFIRHSVVDSHARSSLRVSYLPKVFSEDYGNCLGYSTLYVALGARLGLPLHAVVSPGHCFVRYDDGQVRRNVETTDLGSARDDEYYFGSKDRALAPDALRQGVFLRNLTKRQFLSLILTNYAFTQFWYGAYPGARIAAERALQLDPENHGAHYQLAVALFHSDLDANERACDAMETSLRIWPDADAQVEAGRMHLEFGDPPTARSYFEKAVARGAGNSARAGIALTHAREDRIREALGLLLPALVAAPNDTSLLVAQLECRIRRSPEDVDRQVERAQRHPNLRLLMGVTAAETLLDLDRPQAALVQLDRVRKIAKKKRSLRGRLSQPIDLRGVGTAAEPKRGYLLARARAYHALDQQAEALAALDKATKLAPPNRDVLVVAKLLGR